MTDFTSLNYLKHGNTRQSRAFDVIEKHNFFGLLANFNPILTGTIPIGIDIETSDLDIICHCPDLKIFRETITSLFAHYNGFSIRESVKSGLDSVVCNFIADDFPIEIFGQNLPTTQQNAYLHMLAEHKILTQRGDEFRNQIIKLKKQGIKTEPAFAMLLGLQGNPYEEMLKV